MKFEKLLLAATLSAGACLPAAAVTVNLAPTGGGSFAGSFTQDATGFIFDNFDTGSTSFSGLVSVALTASSPVSLFTATLNGTDFSYRPELDGSTFAFSSVVSAAPLNLFVFGGAFDDSGVPKSGSYAGTISVAAPVPEPQTWALLLVGIGALGIAAGKHRSGRSASLRKA